MTDKNNRSLVVVQLSGGNDAMNTIIPYNNGIYHDSRSSIHLTEDEVIDIDGVRINFDDGWALIRASNTQPVLVLRFEAVTNIRLKELVKIIKTQIDKYKPLIHFDYEA